MLTIRLLRTGKKNQPSYKVVVTDKGNPPRGGRFVEEIGFFNPKTKEKTFNKERVVYWLSVGAQASDTIHNMLVSEKIIDAPKRKIIFTKKAPASVPENSGVAKPASVPENSGVTQPAVAAEAPVETPAEPEVKTEGSAPAEEPKPATPEENSGEAKPADTDNSGEAKPEETTPAA